MCVCVVVVVRNEKNPHILFKLSQTYGSIIIFVHFETFFIKTQMLENFSPEEGTSPYEGSIPPTIFIHYITITIVNKHLKLQNN